MTNSTPVDFFEKNLGRIRDVEWQVLHQILEQEKPGRLLEVGCRNANWLRRFRDLGWDCVGLDLQPYPTDSDAPPIVQGDVVDIPFADAYFDVIVVSNAIYAFPDCRKAGAEMSRVMRPSGSLVVVTPNGLSALIHLISHYLIESPRLILRFCRTGDPKFAKQAFIPPALSPACRSAWGQLIHWRVKNWNKMLNASFECLRCLPVCFCTMPDYRIFIGPARWPFFCSTNLIVYRKRGCSPRPIAE